MMRHKFLGIALIAALALALAPQASQAQWGVSVGGRNFGVSVGSGFYPGFGAGGFYGGGFYPRSLGWGGGYGYSPYTGWGYGYSPWRSYAGYGWGYSPSYSYSYPIMGGGTNYYSAPTYSSPTYSYSVPSSGYYSSGDSSYSYGMMSPMSPLPNVAFLNVRVPTENAEVWVGGEKTQQEGTWRQYVSPQLNPDKNYTYEVRARWTENGKPVEKTREVTVQANGVSTIDFVGSRSDRGGEDADFERRGTDIERRGTDTERRGTDIERRGTDTERRGVDIDRRGTDTERRGTETERRGTDTTPRDTKPADTTPRGTDTPKSDRP